MADSQQNIMPDWLAQALGIGGGLGSAVGGAFNLFGGGKNPADAANKYINQIPGQTQPYYQPYIDAGRGALGESGAQFSNLTQDPNAMLDKFGAGYKESPGYKYNLEQALAGVNAGAAAGGKLGTLGHQQLLAETASGIASKDYQDYLNHVIGLYGTGLSGLTDMSHKGQQASSDYAQNIANALSQQAAYQYAGQAGNNASRAGGLSNIFSGIGTAAGSLFGGPSGGSAMKWLGHLFGG